MGVQHELHTGAPDSLRVDVLAFAMYLVVEALVLHTVPLIASVAHIDKHHLCQCSGGSVLVSLFSAWKAYVRDSGNTVST